MLNQYGQRVETYPEEDGREHCVDCGSPVGGLATHVCIMATLDHTSPSLSRLYSTSGPRYIPVTD